MDNKGLAAEIKRELDFIKKELDVGLEAKDIVVLEEKVRNSTGILDELSAYCGETAGPDKKMQMSVNLFLKDCISLWKKKFWSIDIHGSSDGSLEVECSKVKFKRALENLILNAMEGGATKVTLSVSPTGIRIEDDGEGISEEDAAIIKERGTTKGAGRGYGLKNVRSFFQTLDWKVALANNENGSGLVVTIGEIKAKKA